MENGWDEVENAQQALKKICDKLNQLGRCSQLIDDLRADGIVRGANGELGFNVKISEDDDEDKDKYGVIRNSDSIKIE